MQALRKEINEVAVADEGSVNDYAQYCANLLQVEASLVCIYVRVDNLLSSG